MTGYGLRSDYTRAISVKSKKQDCIISLNNFNYEQKNYFIYLLCLIFNQCVL